MIRQPGAAIITTQASASSPQATGLWAWLVRHRVRIALYLVIGALLITAYRFQVLPKRADVLFDYFLYMSVATTFTPLPTPPVVVHAALHAPVLLVAVVGALGTVVAYLIEYAVLGRFLALDRLQRVRANRFYLRLAKLFDRLPFLALTIAAFLPLPVDGVRLMAIARGYDRLRYALAAFIGRVPRYAMIASVGYGLKAFTAVGAAALVPAAAAGQVATPAPAVAQPAVPAPAVADPELQRLLARMDSALKNLRDLQGRFRQERRSPAFPDPESSRGELWFRRPGDLVLRYVEPAEQQMLIDSAGVWIYLKAEKQAQRYPFSSPAERDAALAVLWQPTATLERLYVLSRALEPPTGEKPNEGTWLKLAPRDPTLAGAVAAAYVRLGKQTGLADCVVVEKPDGERVRLEIQSLKRNPGIPPSKFVFVPPPGVEVVRF